MTNREIANKIGELFEDKKVYLDENYSIEELAKDLSVDIKTVHAIFAEEIEYSFEEMLCVYRYSDPESKDKSFKYKTLDENEYQQLIDSERIVFKENNPELF